MHDYNKVELMKLKQHVCVCTLQWWRAALRSRIRCKQNDLAGLPSDCQSLESSSLLSLFSSLLFYLLLSAFRSLTLLTLQNNKNFTGGGSRDLLMVQL